MFADGTGRIEEGMTCFHKNEYRPYTQIRQAENELHSYNMDPPTENVTEPKFKQEYQYDDNYYHHCISFASHVLRVR